METPPLTSPSTSAELADLRAEIDRLGLNIPLTDDLSILGTAPDAPAPPIPNRFCAQPISGLDAQADGSPGPAHLAPLPPLRRGRLRADLGRIDGSRAPTAPPGKLRLADDTVEAFAEFVAGIRDAARRRWGHEITLILQLAKPVPTAADGGIDAMDDAADRR